MKKILILIIVLVLGYIIGISSSQDSSIFSMFKNSNPKISQIEILKNTKDSISQITEAAQKETGAIFDKQYLDAMITMYEGSVALSKIGTVAGGRPELRVVAKEVSKEDAETLAQLKKWRDEWYPEEKQNNHSNTVNKPSFVK